MSVQHLIWDYNGTLVDDTQLCLEILNSFLGRFGFPSETYDSYRQRFRFPLADYYSDLGFRLSDDEFSQLSVEFHTVYNQRRFECALHAGVLEMLSELSGNGRQQHVLSAYREPDLREALEHYGIEPHFTQIVGQRNYRGDSKAGLGQDLSQMLGAEPQAILVVGDTTHDFEVAQAIGARCVLVSGGHHPRERLEPCGAPVIDRIEELREHLT